MLKAFPLSLKLLFTDPINLILSIVPAIISLGIYLFSFFYIYQNADTFINFFRNYAYTTDSATVYGKILTVIFIIFLFFLFSWTFILMVGIISSPFNSILSSRIEQKLILHMKLDGDRRHALLLVRRTMKENFTNEIKKVFYLGIIGVFTFFINLIPILYPLAIIIISTLFAIQFVDYSWSRHQLSLKDCLKDLSKNILPYFVSGIIFLALISIPIVSAFIPAFATSYFTVLWIHRNKKINH